LPILMRSNDKGLVVAAWHDERRGQERDVYANVSLDGGKTFLEKDIWVSKDYDHASTPALMLDGQDIHVFFVGQTIQNKKSKAAKRQEVKKQKSAKDKEKKGDKSAAKSEPEKRDIYLVHRFSRDHGKTWKESRLATLNATDTSDLLTPLVVAGQAGGAPRMWLVWRQGLAGLHGSYSDDRGASWKAAKLPPPPHGEYVVTMSAATAKDKIFISYARTFPGEPTAKPDVWILQAHERGDRWDEPRRLSTEPHKLTQSFAPQVTANDSGQVVVVWQDYRNIRSGVYMNYSTDFGATWLPQDRVLEEPGKFNSTYPHIISLGGGRYDVAFLRYADDRFKEGGLWATRVEIK
jgi:DNA-binding PadR family transcriptional regulator